MNHIFSQYNFINLTKVFQKCIIGFVKKKEKKCLNLIVTVALTCMAVAIELSHMFYDVIIIFLYLTIVTFQGEKKRSKFRFIFQ